MQWIEISKELGAALWSAYRKELKPGGAIGIHETFSDPRGEYGRSTMMTVIGTGVPLLRLETRWDENLRETEWGIIPYRIDEETRYWLPGTPRDDS